MYVHYIDYKKSCYEFGKASFHMGKTEYLSRKTTSAECTFLIERKKSKTSARFCTDPNLLASDRQSSPNFFIVVLAQVVSS
jgi:hypothetical protein